VSYPTVLLYYNLKELRERKNRRNHINLKALDGRILLPLNLLRDGK